MLSQKNPAPLRPVNSDVVANLADQVFSEFTGRGGNISVVAFFSVSNAKNINPPCAANTVNSVSIELAHASRRGLFAAATPVANRRFRRWW